MNLFPVKKLSVITGAEGSHQPISAIHPAAVEKEKNDLIAAAISDALAGSYAESSGAALSEGDAEPGAESK